MKTEKKIKLLTDDMAPAPDPLGVLNVGDEALEGEQAEIDALLRITADELTAEIDFDGIRERALKSAKEKKRRANRARKTAGYLLITAASFLLMFALVSVIRSAAPKGNNYVLNSSAPHETGSADMRALPTAATGETVRRIEIGTVNESEEQLVKSVSDLLPENLPTGMTTLVDQDSMKICATGTDEEGEELSCVCSLETSVPIQLALGELGAVTDGEENTYYWQLADGQYLSLKCTGFEVADADTLFVQISQQLSETSRDSNRTGCIAVSKAA